MASTTTIADFVRENYTGQGIEVEGEGAGRVLLRMPPVVQNVTLLCQDLMEIFGASCDLVIDGNETTRCVVLEVYSPRGAEDGPPTPKPHAGPPQPPPPPQPQPQPWRGNTAAACTWALQHVAVPIVVAGAFWVAVLAVTFPQHAATFVAAGGGGDGAKP